MAADKDAEFKLRDNENDSTKGLPTQTCIICGNDVPVCQLTTPRDLDSWLSLLHAAKIRNSGPILQYQHYVDVIPHVMYESKCRSEFYTQESADQIATIMFYNIRRHGRISSPSHSTSFSK